MHRFKTRPMRPLQRLVLWLVGVVLVIIFAVVNSGSDFDLSIFLEHPRTRTHA